MYVAHHNTQDHIKNDWVSTLVYSTISVDSRWSFTVHNSIEVLMRHE